MKPQKELTDAEYQAKYIDNQPKNPANKKYGFCEPKTNDDKVWSLKLQKSWNEKGKEKNIQISRKHATKYQLEQLALYQLKQQKEKGK